MASSVSAASQPPRGPLRHFNERIDNFVILVLTIKMLWQRSVYLSSILVFATASMRHIPGRADQLVFQ